MRNIHETRRNVILYNPLLLKTNYLCTLYMYMFHVSSFLPVINKEKLKKDLLNVLTKDVS